MKARVLDMLVCSVCGSDLSLATDEPNGEELETGEIVCAEGHVFPIVDGVPRLIASAAVQQGDTSNAARSIHESFSREWSHFDYEEDRTWGQSVEHRRRAFLRHTDRDTGSLEGKLVLDAGCGNGALSNAITTYGCEVVATDISGSVVSAHKHFVEGLANPRLHFVQGDLMSSPVKPGTFDIVYCAGVLHHTPNTRATFERVARAVAPGGEMFVWLYWRVPGVKPALSEFVRRAVSPLPAPAKHVVVRGLLPQTMLRQWVRSRRTLEPRLNSRELLVRMLDSYTPRYRWCHTPDEVEGWFADLGFTNVRLTEQEVEGFGVVAHRPASAEAASTPALLERAS